ncbi:MAG: hypothetical protein AAGD05_06685, partial [Bacteroidota bacterium]
MATRKKGPTDESKANEGTEQKQPEMHPTMPFYCTWLPTACPPQEEQADPQTIAATLPPMCPITVAQAIGAHAQTLSAPPNCPTVQQCPPTWNCPGAQVQGAATVTAATQCTQPPACPAIGQTGWQGCAPQATTTVHPSFICGGTTQPHTILPTTNPTAATRCFICPPTGTATTTVHPTFICNVQGQPQAQAQALTIPTLPTICPVTGPTICPPSVGCPRQGAQAQVAGPIPTTYTQLNCQTQTGCPQPTTYTQIGCAHITLLTAPPTCTGIHTNACPIGVTGWEGCGHTVATVCTQTGGPINTIVTIPPNCTGIHTNTCPIGVTGWQGCGHTVATVCTQTACPRPTIQTQITCPQNIMLTTPPNCGGIQTNTCPIGVTGWQGCGHTVATVCTQIGCPVNTVVTAPPNCTGIQTNTCPIGVTGWQGCGHTDATV